LNWKIDQHIGGLEKGVLPIVTYGFLDHIILKEKLKIMKKLIHRAKKFLMITTTIFLIKNLTTMID